MRLLHTIYDFCWLRYSCNKPRSLFFFVLFSRSGSVLPAAASATAASAANARVAVQPGSSSPWLSTTASPTSTPTSSGGRWRSTTLIHFYQNTVPVHPWTLALLLAAFATNWRMRRKWTCDQVCSDVPSTFRSNKTDTTSGLFVFFKWIKQFIQVYKEMRHLILIQLLAFVVVYIQYKNPLFKIERDK